MCVCVTHLSVTHHRPHNPFTTLPAVVYPFFVMYIDREKLLQTALQQIMAASDNDLIKPLRVVFMNEEAIDEGGVRKEFFQLLVSKLFSPEFGKMCPVFLCSIQAVRSIASVRAVIAAMRSAGDLPLCCVCVMISPTALMPQCMSTVLAGMFVATADQRSFWINQCCLWSAEEYRLVGVLLGLAVYNNVLLDVHLPKVMFNKLLQVEDFELGDVACIDPLLCEGLSKLLEFEPSKDVEIVFCRTFEVEWEEYGATMKHELIPSGGSIPVDGDNRADYVQRLVKWMLVDSVRQQFNDLYLGFSRVINPDWTMICTGGKSVMSWKKLSLILRSSL